MTAPVTVVVAKRPWVVEDRGNVVLGRPCRKGDVVEVPCPDCHNDDPAKGCTGECDPHTGAFKHGTVRLRLTKEPEYGLFAVGAGRHQRRKWGYRLTGEWTEDR